VDVIWLSLGMMALQHTIPLSLNEITEEEGLCVNNDIQFKEYTFNT